MCQNRGDRVHNVIIESMSIIQPYSFYPPDFDFARKQPIVIHKGYSPL